ncbi:DUF3450 domain-containing protein [Acinetobacter sp. ME22]|uniref:DUF3450 domain-containing protein n=1 Tax=Acinetobacter sp. ME22 TaxID=2904802 RepID=UPI001EDA989D|nr:DUF3450 domain-containing protein [Acinetobacter sp. ME22]MCG2575245.1 DUF3450 domain-containing protein [Acinetobacter sp. ME22]
MAVKNLGKLTLDLVEELSQSEKSNQEETLIAEMDSSNSTLKDRLMDLINKEQLHKSNFSQNATTSMDAMAMAKKAEISAHIQSAYLSPFDHNYYDQIEKQQKKISQVLQREHERKEKLDTERQDQLIAAIDRSNNQRALADENAQLKAEIEKLKLENKQLKKIKENLGTKESDNVLKIVTILADMAGLPKLNPSTAFNMMEAHAANKGLEIPSSNTVTKWLKG